MTDLQTTKDRLIEFIKSLGIGQGKFEKNCGLSNGWVNNIKATIKEDKLQKIILKYPELNTVWLLTGEGTMLKMQLSDEKPIEHNTNEEMIEKLKEANENLERYKQLTKQQSTTIDNQQKLIEMLQKQIERIEKQTGGNADEDKQG